MNKEIQVYIQDLLKHLAILIPPSGQARHGMHINDDGQLTIAILVEGMWQNISFDDDYIDISAIDLANEIKQSIDNIKK